MNPKTVRHRSSDEIASGLADLGDSLAGQLAKLERIRTQDLAERVLVNLAGATREIGGLIEALKREAHHATR